MRYLSAQWLTAANEAVQSSPPPPAGSRLIIDQVVDGAASWRVVVGDTAQIGAQPDDGSIADATFRQSIATAQAIASGTTDAHQAFLLGEIRFEGNIEALIEHRAVLQWLHDALAPVMAETTWD